MNGTNLSRWNPWRGLGDLPRPLWILFFASLVNRAGTMVLPFLALYVTEGLDLPASRAALLLAVYGVSSLFAAPVGGRLCDLFGSVPVMRLSLLTSGIVLVLFPLAPSWGWILAATVAYAVTSEAFRPASMTALVELAPHGKRKAAFAMIRLAVNLGMSVGPALGGFLATVSFSWLFWTDGITSLLAAALVFLWPPRAAKAPAEPEAGGSALGEPATTSVIALPPDVPAWKNRRLTFFLLACLPIIVVFFQHVGAMPLDLVGNLGLSTAFFGALFTINTLVIVFLEVRINFATSHWTHARSLALGAVLTAVGFGALAVARTPWAVVATVLIWTFGEMVLLPSMSDFVAEVAHPSRRGEAMGFYTMTWGLAFTFGPSTGTLVLERFGPVVLWGACLVLGLLAAALLARAAAFRLPPRESALS